jgi:hypothetical protein
VSRSSELLRVSVKQLEMAFNCPRKWAYHYLEKVPQLEGEALIVGNLVHHDMKCLITGKPPVHGPETFIGKMCRELYSNYVKNHSGRHQSEIIKQVKLPEYGLVVDLRADYLDRPRLKDWKTTGAPSPGATLPCLLGGKKPWALQSLENEFQPNVYSFLLMRDHWKGETIIPADWCFVSKKFKEGQAPRTWVISHAFEWEATKTWFERYAIPAADLIRDMRQAWAEKTLDNCRQVPHNLKSCEGAGLFCDAAGRCAFKGSPVMTYKDLQLPSLPSDKKG